MSKVTAQELGDMVRECAALSWLKFRKNNVGLSPNVPLIRYNKRLKTTGGRAFLGRGYIDLSNSLLWQYQEKFINFVIPHEFGHLVAYTLYQDSGHGKAWKRTMLESGYSDARCYTFHLEK